MLDQLSNLKPKYGIAITATLNISGQNYDVMRLNYGFHRETDIKGRTVTNMQGGSIILTMESTKITELLELMLNTDPEYHSSHRPRPVSGSIEVYDAEDGIAIRRLVFEEAFIYSVGEAISADSYLPMTQAIAISPLRLDVNRTVRLDRRWPQAPFGWQEYVQEEQAAVMTKESEPSFTIIDAYWIDENGREIRDLNVETEVTLYVKIEEEEAIGRSVPLIFEDNIGYLAEDDCRIHVLKNGDIEFWPEHFGFIAQGEWNKLNFPYKYEGKVFIVREGKQHLGVPRTVGYLRKPSESSSSSGNYDIEDANNGEVPKDNHDEYEENLRNRDYPEIEDQTPKSGINNPPTRTQRSRERRTGGVVKPPTGLKGGAVTTLVLDVALMAYDVIAPIAVNIERDKINEHYDIAANQVIEDINVAYRSGWMERELTLAESSQLINVVLYGESNDISDSIYELGKYIYKHISDFKKVK